MAELLYLKVGEEVLPGPLPPLSLAFSQAHHLPVFESNVFCKFVFRLNPSESAVWLVLNGLPSLACLFYLRVFSCFETKIRFSLNGYSV